MPYSLGIDVGTSNTAAAIAEIAGDSIRTRALRLGRGADGVPTAVHVGDDADVTVGDVALRRGVDDPSRLVTAFKRRIGDDVPIALGDLDVAAEELYALVVEWVVEHATEEQGEAPASIVLTHPAAWGAHRLGLVRDALVEHGMHRVELLSEPEAAALRYAETGRIRAGDAVAVYDLGGGTFDAAVVRVGDDGLPAVLGRPLGIDSLGGEDFDEAVLAHVDALADAALSNADDTRESLLGLARTRRECVEAKEALSFDTETSVPVLLGGSARTVRLVRGELEEMIAGRVRETVDVLERAVSSAGLSADGLAAILLAGGSSRIPLISQTLSDALARPIAVDADPKAVTCLGAAVAGARALQADARAADAAAAASDADAALTSPAGTVRPARPVGRAAGAFGAGDSSSDVPFASVAALAAPRALASRPWYRRRGPLVATVVSGAAAMIVLFAPITPIGVGVGALVGDVVAEIHRGLTDETGAPFVGQPAPAGAEEIGESGGGRAGSGSSSAGAGSAKPAGSAAATPGEPGGAQPDGAQPDGTPPPETTGQSTPPTPDAPEQVGPSPSTSTPPTDPAPVDPSPTTSTPPVDPGPTAPAPADPSPEPSASSVTATTDPEPPVPPAADPVVQV